MKTIVVIILLLLLFVQWPVTYEALAQDGWVIRMNGLPTDAAYYSAAIVDSQTIWIAGAFSVYRTTDLGLTWYEANRPGAPLGFPHTWGTIDAWDALNAVVATAGDPEGRIFRTSDGGKIWHKVFEDQSITWYFNDLEMVTDSVGYAVGDSPNSQSPPAIVKTTDAGWTWTPTSHNLPLGCYQWFGPTTDFINPQVGWSYQHFPEQGEIALFKTTDGGVTWDETSAPQGWGVCFIDDSIGLTCPGIYSADSIHRTTDGGLTWESKGVVGGRFILASPNGERIWSGSGQASDDSGNTWYTQNLPQGPIRNGSFYSKDIGVLVGEMQTSPRPPFASVPVVLVTTTGGNEVVDAEFDDLVPGAYTLAQNYPNPFNPSTTIEFALPRAGFVTLKVYNVLGEEVATLITGDHAAGTFKATWDVSDMPSGMYFYRLTAGEYVQTMKMVLMR